MIKVVLLNLLMFFAIGLIILIGRYIRIRNIGSY